MPTAPSLQLYLKNYHVSVLFCLSSDLTVTCSGVTGSTPPMPLCLDWESALADFLLMKLVAMAASLRSGDTERRIASPLVAPPSDVACPLAAGRRSSTFSRTLCLLSVTISC